MWIPWGRRVESRAYDACSPAVNRSNEGLDREVVARSWDKVVRSSMEAIISKAERRSRAAT
jgi:hypothetical protein